MGCDSSEDRPTGAFADLQSSIVAAMTDKPDTITIPLSDANDLDAVIHALGIEDSDTTPAEAVAELKAEIERLHGEIERQKIELEGAVHNRFYDQADAFLRV